MKVAIYARYSSENQRPESIEDQIRGCQELAVARGYSVDPAHIYRDETKSGASRDRSGLEALLAAARARQFEAVLVDDLSRPSEAQVVLRIFREFSAGKAIKALAKELNLEKVQGRRKFQRGWSPSTIGRILKNEKYMGRWIWNRSETRRDPKTGRKRKFPKPESEWHVSHNEELRIVPQEIWDRAVARWKEIDPSWPQRHTGEPAGTPQRSYVEANPPHLLSGALRCGVCGGTIGQVSGKGSGYYGCLGAARGACANKLLVSRRITEKAVLAAVRERLLDPESVRSVLERVEAEVQRLHAHLPEEIQVKRASSQVGRGEGGRPAP